MHKAMFYEVFNKEKNIVKCNLCPHHCIIHPDKLGVCGVRKNMDGKLYSLVYDKIQGAAIDPIEKKPMYHFFPGTDIFSFSTVGCNFKCDFCQNWQTSQASKGTKGNITGQTVSPEDIVREAINHKCKSIAMTYNEPTIFFELAYDVSKLAKEKGLFTVFVSNGYITEQAIDKIAPVLDGINIDLKSFSDEFYKKICGGRLQPVLDSIKHYHKKGVIVEITTLIISGKNDSDEELTKIAEYIASISKDIPLHLSAFHPDFKMMDVPYTSAETLQRAYQIGKKAGLNYIYTGNIRINRKETTFCPECKKELIRRRGYSVLENNIEDGKCGFCGKMIYGKFQQNI